MIIFASLASIIAGYLLGRWYEKMLWIYYDRVIMSDGVAHRWDYKSSKWKPL